MANTELINLPRARLRVHRQLAKLEPLVACYHEKLARIEAKIQATDPKLWSPPRRYRSTPYFARQELPRLALAILREAEEPLAIRDIAWRAVAEKGNRFPDRSTMKETRVRLQQFLGKLDRRGVSRKIGIGNATQRVLMERESP